MISSVCGFRNFYYIEIYDDYVSPSAHSHTSSYRQRLETMKRLYESVSHASSQAPPTSLSSHGGDPFYDRQPWFRLIGRSFVYLSNLLIPLSLVHKLAVVNEKGEVKGHLTVSIRFVSGKYSAQHLFYV